ncbi:MAG: isoamylase early set domain-containing protein, partial [Candidatus Methylomirabilales bacterium]
GGPRIAPGTDDHSHIGSIHHPADEEAVEQMRRWMCPSHIFVVGVVTSMAACAHELIPPGVLFHLQAPDARQVYLVGSFNGWDPLAHPMAGPDRQEGWTLRLELPPGRYRYMFLVDGERWVTDPAAEAHEEDGFGNLNAILFIEDCNGSPCPPSNKQR